MQAEPASGQRPAPARERSVPVLAVHHVSKSYSARRGGRERVLAVNDVSFVIEPGAAVGLVGASGSGKTTIAKMVTGSERPDSGTVHFGQIAIERLHFRGMRQLHRRVQMVFQDPYGALNPVHTVEYAIARPCVNYLGMSASQARERVKELLERVGLTPPDQFAGKLPHQLSGGQRQRVVIARALACEPELLVADEPVSMLDVSLRAGVLKLLAQFRAEAGLSLLYITHDLLSARVVTEEVLVLNKGKVVEHGPTKLVLQHPRDPYTVRLLEALPMPKVEKSALGSRNTAPAVTGQRPA